MTVMSVVESSKRESGITPGLWITYWLVSSVCFWGDTADFGKSLGDGTGSRDKKKRNGELVQTYRFSALQGRIFDDLVDDLHVRHCVSGIYVRRFVEEDAVHCQTIVLRVPACVRCYFFGHVGDVLGGPSGSDIPDCFHVGVIIQFEDLSCIVVVWKGVVARAAAGVDHHQKLKFRVSIQPEFISIFSRMKDARGHRKF